MTRLSPMPSARVLRALLVIVFMAAQVTALSHEFEHVLDQHDEPCALHVGADHLMVVAAPEPTVAMGPLPSVRRLSPPPILRHPPRARFTEARAPPSPA